MSDIIEYNREQLDLIKQTICKGATDSEYAMFMEICKRTKLDPFSRQIFLVPRYDGQVKAMVRTPQISIDGLRLTAERSGKYQGQTKPEWCGYNGAWKDLWIGSKDEPYPYAARVGVNKEGFKEPLYAIAKWNAYAQKTKDGHITSMWEKMADLMLAKCAESLALRKAFPQDTFGLYTSEEMGQAEPPADKIVEIEKEVKTSLQLAIEKITDPGEYAPPHGKFEGVKIKDIDPEELNSYIEYIINQSTIKGKPLSVEMKRFISNADDYLTKTFPDSYISSVKP